LIGKSPFSPPFQRGKLKKEKKFIIASPFSKGRPRGILERGYYVLTRRYPEGGRVGILRQAQNEQRWRGDN
jgi:hypothetical protein